MFRPSMQISLSCGGPRFDEGAGRVGLDRVEHLVQALERDWCRGGGRAESEP